MKAKPLTDELLDYLDRLNAAATNDWRLDYTIADVKSLVIDHSHGKVLIVEECVEGEWDGEFQDQIETDLTLAVTVRNALPALLAEIHRLRSETPLVVTQ
jgi:hypothetical protein